MSTNLSQRMVALADSGHPRADELREKAAAFDAVVEEVSPDENSGDQKDVGRRLLGAWARARRVWCECTGEPLI